MFVPGQGGRDPDAGLLVLFHSSIKENPAASAKAGRKIYDDIEVVDIRVAGARDYGTYPAHAFSRWVTDPYSGGQAEQTYAERFQRQYRQFKEQQTQTKQGTPLDALAFLTPARRAELKSVNVYTAEALAAMDGAELKNLGPGGREIKNAAAEFIASAVARAPDLQLAAEIEALRARAQLLEEDNNRLKQQQDKGEGPRDEMFDDMSNDALREYIVTQTGAAPVGSNLNRRSLLRLAAAARPDKAA